MGDRKKLLSPERLDENSGIGVTSEGSKKPATAVVDDMEILHAGLEAISLDQVERSGGTVVSLSELKLRQQKLSLILDSGITSETHYLKWTLQPGKWAQNCADICVITSAPELYPTSLDEFIDDNIDRLTENISMLIQIPFLDGCKGNFRINVGGFQTAGYFHGHFLFNEIQLSTTGAFTNEIHLFAKDGNRINADEAQQAFFEGANIAGSDVYFCFSSNPPLPGADLFEMSFFDKDQFTIHRQSDGYVMDVPIVRNNDNGRIILWWSHGKGHKQLRNQLFKKVINAENPDRFLIESVVAKKHYLSTREGGQLTLQKQGQLFELVNNKYLGAVVCDPVLPPSLQLLASTNKAFERPVRDLKNKYFKADKQSLDSFCRNGCKPEEINLDLKTMDTFIDAANVVLLEHPFFPVFGVRAVTHFEDSLPTDLTRESRKARLSYVMRIVRTLLNIIREDPVQKTIRNHTRRLGFSVFLKLDDSSDGFLVPHFDAQGIQQLSNVPQFGEQEWMQTSALVVVDPRFMFLYLKQKYNIEMQSTSWRSGYNERGEEFSV
mmetsp:Transcript_11813/g.19473  ORF Transcript_11813/g.19473 Transcript_11813/m.19473 type:complete len:550 (+) Transcript_11813:125-1774(+)